MTAFSRNLVPGGGAKRHLSSCKLAFMAYGSAPCLRPLACVWLVLPPERRIDGARRKNHEAPRTIWSSLNRLENRLEPSLNQA